MKEGNMASQEPSTTAGDARSSARPERAHTPGPWEISFEAPRWIIQARGVIGKQAVAYLMGGDYIALAANAHMIAAAPELLASLREVSDMLTGRTDMLAKLHPMMGPAEMAVFERAAAAIAKATGG